MELKNWYAQRHYTQVRLGEVPVTDKTSFSEDYRVVCEIVFHPTNLDSARVEIWLCEDGSVALGIETFERLGMRLKLLVRRKGFVAGFEPQFISAQVILKWLELLAGGRLSLLVKVGWGITSAHVVAKNEEYSYAVSLDARAKYWLRPIDRKPIIGKWVQLELSPWT